MVRTVDRHHRNIPLHERLEGRVRVSCAVRVRQPAAYPTRAERLLHVVIRVDHTVRSVVRQILDVEGRAAAQESSFSQLCSRARGKGR